MIVNGNNEQVPQIVMYDRKKERVHKQSAVLAFDKQNNKIVAIGSDALAYTDGKNSNIEVYCPFQKGKIADFTVALSIFKYMVKEVAGKKSVFSSRNIAVCVPKSSTQVERKAYEEVAFMAGGKRFTLQMIRLKQESRTYLRCLI